MPEDPYVARYIAHGLPNLRTDRGELIHRSQELDSQTVSYRDESATAYAIGTTISDYPYLPIVERRRKPHGAGYLYNLTLEGLADGSTWRETNFDERETEEGFDEASRTIVTRGDPDAAPWTKGSRIVETALTGVTGEADDDKLTKVAHGLTTGQLFTITFASGFTGLTSGGEYWAIVIDADNLKAATTRANALAGTAINITGDGTGATITPVTIGYEYMFVCDRAKRKHRAFTTALPYREVQLLLKGLKGTKPYKRRIDGNSTSSVSRIPSPGLALAATRYTDFPPTIDGTAALGLLEGDEVEYDAATVRVTDAHVYAGDPPFEKIGSPWTPPDPPDVVVLTISGETTKYYWPSGWKCIAMPAEKLPVANVWLLAITWVYQVQTMPGRA